MKLVLLCCALGVLATSTVILVRHGEPTRVRVPASVAEALQVSAEAEIDPTPYEGEPRIPAEDIVPQSEWLSAPRVDPEPDSQPNEQQEPLTDELAAVLRERGLEVQVPAMVLYSGMQLNEALRSFEDGMQELVDRYSDADALAKGIAAMRDRGEDELYIEGEVADWNLSVTAYLTVAANIDRIARNLRDTVDGTGDDSTRVKLRAKVRRPASEDGMSSACSFAEGQPHFGIQFQKREWHFALTIPWTFLEPADREALEAALARLDRVTEAKLARQRGEDPTPRSTGAVPTEGR